MEQLKWVLYGVIIGVANVIPGVSGGTMAVLLGVYDRLVGSISRLRREFLNSMKFLVFIGIGAVAGILLFSKLIEFALANYEMITTYFFIGLILGSLPMLYKKSVRGKLRVSSVIAFLAGLAVMLVLSFAHVADSSAVINAREIGGFVRLFLCSVVAAAAMVVPGISGSFILLLLGCYQTVISAVASLDILTLIPVGLGCIVGIFVCAKIMDKLFRTCEVQTYAGISGLVVGSLVGLYPGFSLDMTGVWSVVSMVIAAAIAFWFSLEIIRKE